MAKTKAIAALEALRDGRPTDDGRLCVDMAIASMHAKRPMEARQWVKLALVADKTKIDGEIAEMIERLKAQAEAQGKAAAVSEDDLGPAIDEAAIERGARADGLRKFDA